MKINYQKALVVTLLSFIVLGAFFIRVQNISEVKNVDELNIVKRAAKMADGQMHIEWYNWPAQSLMRIDGLVFKLSKPWITDQDDINFEELYDTERQKLRTLAHLVTVFFSLLSIIIIYFIGKNIYNYKVGLLAAFFLGIDYLFGLHARYATPDVPTTFAFLLNIFLSLKIYQLPAPDKKVFKKELLYYLAAGAVLGFAVATKYTGALAIVPPGLVFLYRSFKYRQKGIKNIILTFFTCFLGGLVIHTLFNPYFFADFKVIINDILFEAKPDRMGVDFSGQDNKFFLNFYYYLKSSLVFNGTVISLVAYLTMIYSLFKVKTKKWWPVLGILLFFLIILCGLSTLGLHWSRWAVPFSPLTVLFAALGLVKFHEFIKIKYKIIKYILAALILVIISAPQLIISLATGYSFVADSSVKQMSRYIEENTEPGSYIVADTYYLDLDKENYKVVEKSTALKLYKETYEEYKKEGVDYLVIKPKRYSYAKNQPDLYQHIIDFHKALNNQAEKIISFQEDDGILGHKRDYGVYLYLYEQKFKNIFNMCTGTHLVLYQVK